MQKALKVSKIVKKFRKRMIIDSVSFQVEQGEIVGLLGPNGAGKTTILKIISSLLCRQEGRIEICGYDVDSHFENAMKHLGAVIDNPLLYPYMSGYDNLKYFSTIHKVKDKTSIDEAISYVKLEDRIKEKVKTYSLGMRQRLGIAQALLHKPKLLILDEPTNGLDPLGIIDLRQQLRKYANEGGAVLVSSHLISEMEILCDRVLLVKEGSIIGGQKISKGSEGSLLDKWHILIEVDDVIKTRSLLSGYTVLEVREKEGTIKLNGEKEELPNIIKLLCAEGIKVYTVQKRKENLEDLFQSVMG